jgi:hypothetical protein
VGPRTKEWGWVMDCTQTKNLHIPNVVFE